LELKRGEGKGFALKPLMGGGAVDNCGILFLEKRKIIWANLISMRKNRVCGQCVVLATPRNRRVFLAKIRTFKVGR